MFGNIQDIVCFIAFPTPYWLSSFGNWNLFLFECSAMQNGDTVSSNLSKLKPVTYSFSINWSYLGLLLYDHSPEKYREHSLMFTDLRIPKNSEFLLWRKPTWIWTQFVKLHLLCQKILYKQLPSMKETSYHRLVEVRG